MFRFYLRFAIFFAALFVGFNVQAEETTVITTEQVPVTTTTTQQVPVSTTTTTTEQVIVTPAPAPKETVVTPTGYAKCTTVTAGWYQGKWVAEHRYCEYEKATEGVAWVEGYWACDKYSAGVCTNWLWVAGRWVKTVEKY